MNDLSVLSEINKVELPFQNYVYPYAGVETAVVPSGTVSIVK